MGVFLCLLSTKAINHHHQCPLLMLSRRLFSVHHSARPLISSWYEVSPLFGGVISKLYNRVFSISRAALMGAQNEQEGALVLSPGVEEVILQIRTAWVCL